MMIPDRLRMSCVSVLAAFGGGKYLLEKQVSKLWVSSLWSSDALTESLPHTPVDFLT